MESSNAALILDFTQVAPGFLTHGEFLVSLFVLHRTLGWGKDHESVPIRHFLDGHCSRAGKAYLSGTGLSKRTIISAVKSLEQKYRLFTVSHGANNVKAFKLNLENLRNFLKMARLNITRKIKKLDTDEGGCKIAPTRRCKIAPPKSLPNTKDSTPLSESLRSSGKRAAPAGTARSIAEDLVQRHKGKRREKISRLSTKPVKKLVLQAFVSAVREHYQDGSIPILQPSPTDWAVYTRFLQNTDLGKDFDYPDFFDWCIESWDDVMNNDMKWVNNAPLAPDLPFFCRMQKYFIHAYANPVLRKMQSARTSAKNRALHIERKYEDVCKINQQLQEELEEHKLSYEEQRLLEDAPQRLRASEARQRRLTQQVQRLQKENARIRSERNGQNQTQELADYLPTWDELQEAERLAQGVDTYR